MGCSCTKDPLAELWLLVGQYSLDQKDFLWTLNWDTNSITNSGLESLSYSCIVRVRGREKSLREAMKVETPRFWRCRTKKYLLRRVAYGEWNQSKRKVYVASRKKWEEKRHISLLIQDMELLRFGASPAGFWSSFDPVFPHYVSTPPFWNGYIFCPIKCWK